MKKISLYKSDIVTGALLGILTIGLCGLTGLVVGARMRQAEEYENDTKTTIVEVNSKEKTENGTTCIKDLISLTESYTCRPKYQYKVNGETVTEETYNSLEEGKIYNCKLRGKTRIYDCETLWK